MKRFDREEEGNNILRNYGSFVPDNTTLHSINFELLMNVFGS